MIFAGLCAARCDPTAPGVITPAEERANPLACKIESNRELLSIVFVCGNERESVQCAGTRRRPPRIPSSTAPAGVH